MTEQNRNDPCRCESGKKYKKCCMQKNEPFFMIQNASQYPIEKCFINANWKESGLANILVVRKNIEIDKYLFGMFLVDLYCLGVKNVFFNAKLDWNAIQHGIIDYVQEGMVDMDYEECRGLILGAIDFAKKIGFVPHEDWEKAKEFVEPQKPYKTKYKFGKNGKPFYVAGPDDDVEEIIKILGVKGAFVRSFTD